MAIFPLRAFFSMIPSTMPPVIEHNAREQRPTNAIWWILWPIVAVGWIWYLYFVGENWLGVMLGLGTGCVLATFAIEVSGNRFPGSRRD